MRTFLSIACLYLLPFVIFAQKNTNLDYSYLQIDSLIEQEDVESIQEEGIEILRYAQQKAVAEFGLQDSISLMYTNYLIQSLRFQKKYDAADNLIQGVVAIEKEILTKVYCP